MFQKYYNTNIVRLYITPVLCTDGLTIKNYNTNIVRLYITPVLCTDGLTIISICTADLSFVDICIDDGDSIIRRE